MTTDNRVIDLYMLDVLDASWVTADILAIKLQDAYRSRGIVPPSRLDMQACMHPCLARSEDEAWIEVSERIHGTNVLEYRLSPIGMKKKEQFRGI